MRVLHLPFTYFPDPSGGTEVYVAALARELRVLGIDSAIAAPAGSTGPAEYAHEGSRVYRHLVGGRDGGHLSLRALYGEGDAVAAGAVDDLLQTEMPDIVHFHSLTAASSLRVARAARRRGMGVVLTYHTATVTCQRGSLRRYGRDVCDGEIIVSRCAACTLDALGAPAPVNRSLACLPPILGATLGRMGLEGGIWTALRMTELTQLRRNSFAEFVAECDAILAVADWVRALLLRNGVPQSKLRFSRQGVADTVFVRDRNGGDMQVGSAPLRLAFFGRVDEAKGVHVVIDALRLVRGLDLRLDIYSVQQAGAADEYVARLRAAAADDTRVTFREPVEARQVVSTLRGYDGLVVPSQSLETGPLVILEAFAAGAFVVGARLGGIAELVRDGVDGLLVEPASASAWAEAIERLATEPGLRATLRNAVRPPRTMRDVAVDMAALYREVAPARSPSVPALH